MLLLFGVVFMAFGVLAQDITGEWNGVLSVQGMKLRLVFHVTKTDAGYTATMDSPDQGAKGIPMTSARFENNVLTLLTSAQRMLNCILQRVNSNYTVLYVKW